MGVCVLFTHVNVKHYTEAPPPYLHESKTSLVVQQFSDIKDEATLREVHEYLFRKHNLIDRVIRARKLHHSHFFANNEYGHEKYLNKLQNDRHARNSQDAEEAQRETENRKVKLEAMLLKRHQKEVERHQQEMRAHENKKREDDCLKETHAQRLSELSEEEQDSWDPGKDVFGYERHSYIDLIKYFLMMDGHDASADDANAAGAEPSTAKDTAHSIASEEPKSKALSKSAKKRAKKANAGEWKIVDRPQSDAERRGPSVMRGLLNRIYGTMTATAALVQGSPLCLMRRLSHYWGSVEEFLKHAEVTQEQLRDLCLKLERPTLQDVRDACVDFYRSETEEAEDNNVSSKNEVEKREEEKSERKGRKCLTKRRRASKTTGEDLSGDLTSDGDPKGPVDFGEVTDGTDYTREKLRIKICGRYMYNYPSEKTLSWGGRFRFSVNAKDSDIHDTTFAGDLFRQMLLSFGFIPYNYRDVADELTHHVQTGSRGSARRAHQVLQVRDLLCGHIKRDDPSSRRFIQYISMQTRHIVALVRDPKTGRVLTQPPEKELWLAREKSGWGRASRNTFEIISEVGLKLFEEVDQARKWRFSFEEYYMTYTSGILSRPIRHDAQSRNECLQSPRTSTRDGDELWHGAFRTKYTEADALEDEILRPLDLYIDYRAYWPSENTESDPQNPAAFDRTNLLSKARAFRDAHPAAKFSVLRLWSAPHFYPLELSLQRSAMTAFLDDRGRLWHFRFLPKDLPTSEWIIHDQLSAHIEPYREMLQRDQVIVARDMVFVMGKDEKDLRRLTEGTTWAIQTEPWRLEVDFWRSFVNVDLKFLEDMHEKWLE
ncbi:hypothetical protein BDV96DRAFT_601966 [Lophiotrema nucula]|uniref:Uncharacterized protein n=1 Tax=Lophiotrema nucula TaxID=690887 RepID=A0A6A5Z0B9_9PLEO|nr:hypothetical protein BDV96DRAFT_601966 [Lophiotrema nucula]